jgi:hypothetical protein
MTAKIRIVTSACLFLGGGSLFAVASVGALIAASNAVLSLNLLLLALAFLGIGFGLLRRRSLARVLARALFMAAGIIWLLYLLFLLFFLVTVPVLFFAGGGFIGLVFLLVLTPIIIWLIRGLDRKDVIEQFIDRRIVQSDGPNAALDAPRRSS